MTGVTDIFTFDSKLAERVCFVIHSPTLSINFNLKLPDYCRDVQAELIAIIEAVEWLLGSLIIFL